jgi:hypothetical protein
MYENHYNEVCLIVCRMHRKADDDENEHEEDESEEDDDDVFS